jgi:hypothetical protein
MVSPVRKSSKAFKSAGIVLAPNPAAEQRGILSNEVKEIPYCNKFFL